MAQRFVRFGVLLAVASIALGVAAVDSVGAPLSVSGPLSTAQFDGIVGARRIGPVFPEFARGEFVGSRSVLLVESDALSVMEALVGRARERGFQRLPDENNGSCVENQYGLPDDPLPPDRAAFSCVARYGRSDNVALRIELRVCRACPDLVSVATVSLRRQATTNLSPIEGLEVIGSTVQLSTDALRSIEWPPNASLQRPGFPVVKGARLAVPVIDNSNLCTATWVAVLRIDRNLADVVAAYETRLIGADGQVQMIDLRGGRTVRQTTSGNATLTVVAGGNLRHPWMLASACDPTVD